MLIFLPTVLFIYLFLLLCDIYSSAKDVSLAPRHPCTSCINKKVGISLFLFWNNPNCNTFDALVCFMFASSASLIYSLLILICREVVADPEILRE